jgi:Transglycosylase SLT domain
MPLTRIPVAVAAMAVWILFGAAEPARAEIYSCHDALGQLMLSNRPITGIGCTVAVGSSSGVRTSRPAQDVFPNQYDEHIERYAKDYGVRASLVRAVIQVESGYNPRAVSPKGAMGLMQLMPKTAAEMGVRFPFSPAENIRGGVGYLRSLLDRYSGNEELSLAAYNAGPTAVEKYGNTIPPYRETRQYVSRIQNASPGLSRGGRVLYKWVEMVDGRPIPKYSNMKPSNGPYEILHR